MGTARRITQFARETWQKGKGRTGVAIVAGVLAGGILVSGAAAFTTRNAGQQFADATIDKLGGDPQVVLDRIADRVVDRLTSNKGALTGAQKELAKRLGTIAGDKLDAIDTDSLLDDVRGDVVAAGLGKFDDIDTDAIVAQVTQALVDRAMAELEKMDLEAMANSLVSDLAKQVDLEKLVADQLAKIDVQALVAEAVKQQFGGGLLGGLLSR